MQDFQFQRAMVIFAHPDDAEVQCAGTTALWAEAGKEVTYVVVTKGDKGTQDPALSPEVLVAMRQEEQLQAARVLGVGKVLFLDHPDGELEVNLVRRRELTGIIREHQPEVLVTHDPWMRYQMHPDHRATGTLALDALISARDRLYFLEQIARGLSTCRVRRVLLFASEQPDFWMDISPTLERKIEALGRHRSQVVQWPEWEKAVRQRAEKAGASQGWNWAEAFKQLILR